MVIPFFLGLCDVFLLFVLQFSSFPASLNEKPYKDGQTHYETVLVTNKSAVEQLRILLASLAVLVLTREEIHTTIDADAWQTQLRCAFLQKATRWSNVINTISVEHADETRKRTWLWHTISIWHSSGAIRILHCYLERSLFTVKPDQCTPKWLPQWQEPLISLPVGEAII